MKKGKIIAIIIAVIIVIGISIFGINIMNDMKQEKAIRQELSEIDGMSDFENIDKEALNSKLDNIVTTGNYAIVEKTLKTYLSDVFNDTTKLSELLSDEKLTDIMTANNYKKDGPEFKTTKEYLSNSKTQIQEYKDKVYEYFKEEKIMSYINNQGVDSYYVDVYKKLAIDDGEKITQEDKNKIEESINSIYNIIDVGNEVIDFLIQNKGKWEVQGENIAFHTDELVTQYTNMINKLN